MSVLVSSGSTQRAIPRAPSSSEISGKAVTLAITSPERANSPTDAGRAPRLVCRGLLGVRRLRRDGDGAPIEERTMPTAHHEPYQAVGRISAVHVTQSLYGTYNTEKRYLKCSAGPLRGPFAPLGPPQRAKPHDRTKSARARERGRTATCKAAAARWFGARERSTAAPRKSAQRPTPSASAQIRRSARPKPRFETTLPSRCSADRAHCYYEPAIGSAPDTR